MMSITELIEKRMFLLILATILLSIILGGGHPVGINKTVGWAWDVSNWMYWFVYLNWIILFGYGFLSLKKYRSNRYLSGVHLILILVSFLINELLYFNINMIVIFNTVIIIIFIINLIISVSAKRKY